MLHREDRPAGASRQAPPTLVYPLVAVMGFVAAWITVGPDVMAGNPSSLRSASGDTATAMAGFRYYVADSWRWPILSTRQLDYPTGTIVAFSDSVPLMAVMAKGLRFLPITVEQWWGAWFTGSFVFQGVAGAYAVRSWGARTWSAAISIGTLVLMFPPFLNRMHHPALAFNAVILLAIGLAGGLYRQRGRSVAVLAVATPVVALTVHPYHLLVTLVILGGAYLDALRIGLIRTRQLIVWIGATVGVLALVVWAGGYASRGSVSASGYGHYRLFLPSILWPQLSQIRPGDDQILLVGGSPEAFGYLGMGGVILVAVAGVILIRRKDTLLSRHRSLALAIGLLVAFAVTPNISLSPEYHTDIPLGFTRALGSVRGAQLAGGLLFLLVAAAAFQRSRGNSGGRLEWTSVLFQVGLVSGLLGLALIGLPGVLTSFLGTFRTSGRMVWALGYMMMVAGVVVVATRIGSRRTAGLILAGLALVQVFDTEPLRVRARSKFYSDSEKGEQIEALTALASHHSLVHLVPDYRCTADNAALEGFISVIAATSAAQVPVDNAYSARRARSECGRVEPAASDPMTLTIYADPDLVDPSAGDCRAWLESVVACSHHWLDLDPIHRARFSDGH